MLDDIKLGELNEMFLNYDIEELIQINGLIANRLKIKINRRDF